VRRLAGAVSAMGSPSSREPASERSAVESVMA
jgi:hypothetical protein